MSKLVFACLTPHAPILLPTVGSPTDRLAVKKTINALEKLGENLAKIKPDLIIISSPHPDWGFKVPLHFLGKNLDKNIKIKTYLTDLESPQNHFKKGQEIIKSLPRASAANRVGWIASGDMSHRLKEDGPYGFHPAGPKFDQKFIEFLKNKNSGAILRLHPDPAEQAAECGLRSFCMLLGALAASRQTWQPEILSYEGPFGVGYLVANLKIN